MGWPGPMTHRQFEAWQWWLREEWNHPSRSDHYLMQIVAELLRIPAKAWGQRPPDIELDDCRITFGEKRPIVVQPKKPGEFGPPDPLTKEKIAEIERMERQWIMQNGGKVRPPPQIVRNRGKK